MVDEGQRPQALQAEREAVPRLGRDGGRDLTVAHSDDIYIVRQDACQAHGEKENSVRKVVKRKTQALRREIVGKDLLARGTIHTRRRVCGKKIVPMRERSGILAWALPRVVEAGRRATHAHQPFAGAGRTDGGGHRQLPRGGHYSNAGCAKRSRSS